MGDPSGVSDPVQPPYVVLGATGILAPLSSLLPADRKRLGIARGRSPIRGAWDEVVLFDGHDGGAVASFVARLEPGYAVVAYAPTVTPATWEALCRKAARGVVVLTLAYAAPGVAIDEWLTAGEVTTCILGWTGPAGAPRWHTPEEISQVAWSALLAEPGSHLTLGRVRPWTQRP